jgi:gamma-glutamylcyclotransferase (GGCT)/AIG2-like uncharacterized protein YtfP
VRYFFYGTLMDTEIRRCVLGLPLAATAEEAWLSGYRRVRVRGKSYPMLIADADTVHGLLIADITPQQRARLTVFEGSEYREALLPVRGTRSGLVEARVFLPRRPARGALPWSFDQWVRVDKQRFLQGLLASDRMRPARSL